MRKTIAACCHCCFEWEKAQMKKPAGNLNLFTLYRGIKPCPISAKDGRSSSSASAPLEEKVLAPPIHFGIVCPNVYRSSEPSVSNSGYLKTLGLKTIAFLSAESLSKPFKQFIDQSSIKLVC